MYTFYTDKSEDFKCQLEIEGADLSNVSTRLLLKSSEMNLVFEGKVSNDGVCTIPVSKLKNILKEQTVGEAILEVIVDDTYFKPWEDQYTVKTSKKVTAEVISNSKPILERKLEVKVKPQLEESSIEKKEPAKAKETTSIKTHAKIIAEMLSKSGINYNNVLSKSEIVSKVIDTYSKKASLEIPVSSLIKETLEHLK